MEVLLYNHYLKNEWDRFVSASKNGTFLFLRDYMDYHSDRFEDSSLIFKENNSITALLPACRVGNSLVSHAGLTYGGLILNSKATTSGVLHIFDEIISYLRKEGFSDFIYKPVPYIYHDIPAEEDLYALFRNDARLTVRNVSSVIDLKNRLKMRDIRKYGIRKASKLGIEIKESSDYKSFWNILQRNLSEKYNSTPVHSFEEIEVLSSKFPENIILSAAFMDEEIIAGTVLYVTPTVVHTQYISASPLGKETGALDLLFDNMLKKFNNRKYFDFGTSNEDGGRRLNESLIYQKEGFGGRAVCYDTYLLKI